MNKKTVLINSVLLLFGSKAYGAQTFIGSIKNDAKVITYEELKNKVSKHAKKKGYLSLGESHLEKDTATAINFELLETYYSNTKQRRSVFCTETLSHFLEPYGERIKDYVRRYRVFEDNSPTVTDFTKCKSRRRYKNYVVYSGFFHQYPFARNFPDEFVQTPVITKPKNNIKEQMKKLDGLFVTQMEMSYMEFSATKAFLNSKFDNVSKFKAELEKLKSKVALIDNSMETLIDSGSPYTSKKAMIISSKDFDVDLNANDKSYFMLTNLSYRKAEDTLFALKAISKFDDEKLTKFLTKMNKSKKYINSVFFDPDETGSRGTVTYPTIERVFAGSSIFLHIRNEQDDMLMVMEPKATDFVCFDYRTKLETNCYQ